MPAAVAGDGGLGAPTVGRWTPRIVPGAPLIEGALLGHLLRAGRLVRVTAPPGAGGVAVEVAPAGSWVEYGAVLVTPGEGERVAGPTRPGGKAAAGGPPDGVVAVCADTDGTVFLRADPDAPPFAPQGATMRAHATLALVEVMKTFTPVRCPVAGTVERVLVADGAAVGAGEPLLWVRVEPSVG